MCVCIYIYMAYIYVYIKKIITMIKTTSIPYPSCHKVSLLPSSCPSPHSSQATTGLISVAIKLLGFSNFFLMESFNKYSIVHSIILANDMPQLVYPFTC